MKELLHMKVDPFSQRQNKCQKDTQKVQIYKQENALAPSLKDA
jgi:hypothetical protein